MKKELTAALISVQKGDAASAAAQWEAIRRLPRTSDGLFDTASVDSDPYEAAKLVYPVYAAYETECNKKEGYPDLLAQMRILDGKLEEDDTLEHTAAFLETLIGTIGCMSPQLYEYYREMTDLFQKRVRRAMARYLKEGSFGPAGGPADSSIRGAVERGCAAHLLLAEKYQMAVKDAPREESPVDGSQGGASCLAVGLVFCTARSAVIEIKDGGRYYTRKPYRVLVNGREALTARKVITSLSDLRPGSSQRVEVYDGGEKQGELCFCTEEEFVTLDVRRFGAKGDGVQDDTHFIQAAILACPEKGRVLVPAGCYRITSLFLKSHLRLELAEGAELKAFTDKEKFPVFPGMIESYDEKGQYNLGSWEGNPLPMYTAILCGVNVEDVVIYGKGTLNGNASKDTWWKDVKKIKDVFRPRLFFVNHCKNVTLQGITCCNSPAWTLHPYFSDDLRFLDLNVENPSDSPNTDGLDPESCRNVEILGVRFSLGDDCIAVKSGKIYMGKTYKRPSENIHIRQCLMEDGHGAVTLGSEMAGGVKDLTVEDCIFRRTDRGLRIKTRRGRGKDAVLSGITFRNLTLDHVMTPLVVNAFYFCDPDGKTPYVQSREPYPVDERTPSIQKMVFENMECTNCHVAAAFFDGLPEQKIEEIQMRNLSFSYAENPRCDVPAMSEGVPKCTKRGIFARNVAKLVMENVAVEGQEGAPCEFIGVEELIKKGHTPE